MASPSKDPLHSWDGKSPAHVLVVLLTVSTFAFVSMSFFLNKNSDFPHSLQRRDSQSVIMVIVTVKYVIFVAKRFQIAVAGSGQSDRRSACANYRVEHLPAQRAEVTTLQPNN